MGRHASELRQRLWMLQLERRPDEWLDLPVSKRTVKKPRPMKWDEAGRQTRWVDKGPALDF